MHKLWHKQNQKEVENNNNNNKEKVGGGGVKEERRENHLLRCHGDETYITDDTYHIGSRTGDSRLASVNWQFFPTPFTLRCFKNMPGILEHSISCCLVLRILFLAFSGEWDMSACHGVEEYYLYDSQINFSCCLLTITGQLRNESLSDADGKDVPPIELCFGSIIIIWGCRTVRGILIIIIWGWLRLRLASQLGGELSFWWEGGL